MIDLDVRRLEIFIHLSCGQISTVEAAQLLGVSVRQVRRLQVRFANGGAQALVHGNIGCIPINRTDCDVETRIIELTRPGSLYYDFNVCHLREVLSSSENIEISRSTLDRLLRRQRGSVSKTKPKVNRQRRERMSCVGEMLQVDGSPHDWLEGRGPRMTLMGAIDDASSEVVYVNFRPTEDQAGYLMMVRDIVLRHGIPASIYHDKHTILRSPKEPTIEEELARKKPMSEVQRIMSELGIEGIAAHSPQAKGRIERLWKTLQDRLVKDMRLAHINDIKEANAFLPEFIFKHNTRFRTTPTSQETAWVTVQEPFDTAYYFAATDSRSIKNDHTLGYKGLTLQIVRSKMEANLAGKTVKIHITPERELYIYDKRQRLQSRLVAPLDCQHPFIIH